MIILKENADVRYMAFHYLDYEGSKGLTWGIISISIFLICNSFYATC
jgi:hypothetical protein